MSPEAYLVDQYLSLCGGLAVLAAVIFVIVKIGETAIEARRARQILSIVHDAALAAFVEQMEAEAAGETDAARRRVCQARAKAARRLRLL